MQLPLEILVRILRFAGPEEIDAIARTRNNRFMALLDAFSTDIVLPWQGTLDPFGIVARETDLMFDLHLLQSFLSMKCALCMKLGASFLDMSLGDTVCHRCSDTRKVVCRSCGGTSLIANELNTQRKVPLEGSDSLEGSSGLGFEFLSQCCEPDLVKGRCVPFLNWNSFNPQTPSYTVVAPGSVKNHRETCSLHTAIKKATPGSTVLIHRGIVIHESFCAFEVHKQLRIRGESEEEYLERKGMSYGQHHQIPPRPQISVTNNSALIHTSPLIIENIELESGHNCPSCDFRFMDSFSAITSEDMLMLKNCAIRAYQGSCIVGHGSMCRIISQYSQYYTRFFCIYLDEGLVMAHHCMGNTFGMNRNRAICQGITELNNRNAELIRTLDHYENQFDELNDWPPSDY